MLGMGVLGMGMLGMGMRGMGMLGMGGLGMGGRAVGVRGAGVVGRGVRAAWEPGWELRGRVEAMTGARSRVLPCPLSPPRHTNRRLSRHTAGL